MWAIQLGSHLYGSNISVKPNHSLSLSSSALGSKLGFLSANSALRSELELSTQHSKHGYQCVPNDPFFPFSFSTLTHTIILSLTLSYCVVLCCAAMAKSFLQVAATEEAAPPLRVIQMEGLVFFLFFCFSIQLSLHFNCRS